MCPASEPDSFDDPYYSTLRLRGEEAYCSLLAGYGHDPARHPFSIRFVNNREFNASADRHSGQRFVTIDIACIHVSEALLGCILAQPGVLPQLPIDRRSTTPRKLPFSRRPAPITPDHELAFDLDEQRAQIARILTDFWMTYILAHELGHVVCGHPQGSSFYFGESSYRENFSIDQWLYRGRYPKRAWELDADAFGAVILGQYLQRFVNVTKTQEIELAFGWCKGDPVRLTGIVLAAMLVLFNYLSGHSYRSDRRTVHPSPPLRAKSTGDIVIRTMSSTFGIHPNRFVAARNQYAAQMLYEMEAVGLFNWDQFDSDFNNAAVDIAFDAKLQQRFRRSCERWTLVPIDIWGS